MHKQIVIMALATSIISIMLIGGSVLWVVGDHQQSESIRAINVAQEHLRNKFRLFDLLIAEDEALLEKIIERDLPKIANALSAWEHKLEKIPQRLLNDLCDQYNADEIYVINRKGIVINTNFLPDMNFNLRGVSLVMASLLDRLYGRGEVVSDRFNISVATGTIKKYSYYSAPNSDYIIEISHHLKPYLSQLRSDHYVDFLFRELFSFGAVSNTGITNVDILIPHDIGVWSLLNPSKSIDSSIAEKLIGFEQSKITVEDGNRVKIFRKFPRTGGDKGQTPYFITQIEYDNQYHHDALVKVSSILVLIVVIIVIASFVAVSLYMNRNVVFHIKRIITHLNALATGEQEKLNIKKPLEFRRISEAINHMQEKIFQRERELRIVNEDFEKALVARTCELKKANTQLEILSFNDGLTSLANRRRFDTALQGELRRLRRYGGTLSLIIMDIDYFKDYNDSLGHVAGDECLKQVALCLSGMILRAPDLAARYGGEEFAVILPEMTADKAEEVSNRIRESVLDLSIKHPSSECADVVTVSVGGISIKIDQDYSPQDIVNKADELLYQAKSNKRNCVRFRDFT